MADSPNPEEVQPEPISDADASGTNEPTPPADDATSEALQAAMDAVNNLRDETDDATGAVPGGDSGNQAGDTTPMPTEQPAAAGDKANAGNGEQISLPEFSASNSNGETSGINLLSKVNLNVRIELGRTKMLVEDVLRLNEGSVVELDKLAGDPVDIFVNDRLVACGEVLVLNDAFSVRISEIIGQNATAT